jgi:hypothetical protein
MQDDGGISYSNRFKLAIQERKNYTDDKTVHGIT